MQITVFGANGKVGRLVVVGALAAGYDVVAFVHKSRDFADNSHLKIVQGDIYNSADVTKAIKGSDAVISALGSWGTPTKDVLTTGIQHIIPAMKSAKIDRIISLTGGAANAPGDKLNVADKISHALLGLFASKILHDGEQHINLLDKSDLNYTVLRSGIMNERGNILDLSKTPTSPNQMISAGSDLSSLDVPTGTSPSAKPLPTRANLTWESTILHKSGIANYKLVTKRPGPWATINRYAVAKSMLDQLGSEQHVRQSPFIVRS